MENTGYVALSFAVGLERKMSVVANNIANVDTAGYKSSHVLFNEYVVKNTRQPPLSMMNDIGNYRNAAPGPIQVTGNPLDVALEGNGFLAVMTPEGERYTRNGTLRLDVQGQLITSAGDQVVDEGGKPIIIPAGSGQINITPEGTISTDQGDVGAFKIVRFDDPQSLVPIGDTLYETDQAPIIDENTRVTQGAVEGSNVNSVMEMTNMIEVMRKYQSVARLLQNEHDSQINMIQKLGRV